MTTLPGPRRRPSVHITLARASRLHRLVWFIGQSPRTRDAVLSHLGIGLRTFYRELELLKKCGVKFRYRDRVYVLLATAEQAEGLLPFPDPQLSFAEMAALAACPCDAGRRLADLLASVINPAPLPPKKRRNGRKPKAPRGTS